jgi:predicted phage tail protein
MEELNKDYIKKIEGSGGSSKSGSKNSTGNSTGAAPTEAKNTLRSRSDAVMLLLACEGEIQGFSTADPLQSIFLDSTPIKNLDGSLNFQNINIDYRFGTQYQSYIAGMASDVENERAISVQMRASSGAVTRTILNSDANAYRVRVSVPSLLEQDDKGNIKESLVRFKIELSSQGGAFVQQLDKTIQGKTSGAYEESYRLPLFGSSPWEVRVTRITPDSNKTTIQNTLFWQSLTEITDVKLSYPNSVIFGIRVSSEQFSNIPKIAVKLKLLKILIPHNYNPTTRIYSGSFSGTLYRAYSNNPAWVFYDLATNGRYGSGKYIAESLMDVFDLYSIGQYCDELVPNGRGGLEPRFVCNCIIQNQDDAFRVLTSIASCFRGMMFEKSGELTAIQDKPSSAVRIYTKANVACEYDESGQMSSPPFNYSGTALDTRYTVARVSYSDPDKNYETVEEVIEDLTAIAKFGYIPTEITAFGCTSRGQAYRLGKWLLLSQRLLTQVITFRVGAEGALVVPGEVFKVMDTLKTLDRLGGKIITATVSSVTLDSSVTLSAGIIYTLSIVKSDGKVESKTVSNTAGTYSVLNVTSNYSETPRHLWIMESNVLKAQSFRCNSVAQIEDHLYEITGVEYNESIYATVENSGFVLDKPITSTYPNATIPPEPPSGLTIIESLYETIGSAGVRTKVDIFWTASPSPFIDRYQIEYALNSTRVTNLITTTKDLSTTLYDITPDIYDFRIKTINRYNVSSVYANTVTIIKGLTAPPATVANFTIVFSNSLATFSWDQTPDLDVKVGGYFKIKYTSKLSDVSWADGIEVARIPGITNTFQTYAMNGTYSIKAVDSSEQQSSASSQIIVSGAPDLINRNIVITTTQDPTFSGTKTNVINASGILKLNSYDYFDVQPGLFDSYPGMFDDVAGYWDSFLGLFDSAAGTIDEAGNLFAVFPEGSYDFDSTIDLLSVSPVRLIANISGFSVNESINFDRTGGLFDSATGNFDGQDNDNSSMSLLVATSMDGTIFDNYEPFLLSEYIARAFKFRVILKSNEANHNYFLQKLSITIDMPDRLEAGNITTSASVNTTIVYGQAFAAVPETALTVQNGLTGDYIEIISKTNANLVFNIRNSAGVRQARLVSYLAKGYGQIIP